MTERKPLQKKLRFEVFKRDLFTCQYCGSKPPTVILEIDHIDPVKNGGTNAIENLITACFDCNRGKSDRLLTAMPETLERRAEVLAEKEAQIQAYNRMVKAQRKREEKAIDAVERVFQRKHDYIFAPQFRKSVRLFLTMLPQDAVEDAMETACWRTEEPGPATKYFCGICWNLIRGGER